MQCDMCVRFTARFVYAVEGHNDQGGKQHIKERIWKICFL
jgi:hypothetical protein